MRGPIKNWARVGITCVHTRRSPVVPGRTHHILAKNGWEQWRDTVWTMWVFDGLYLFKIPTPIQCACMNEAGIQLRQNTWRLAIITFEISYHMQTLGTNKNMSRHQYVSNVRCAVVKVLMVCKGVWLLFKGVCMPSAFLGCFNVMCCLRLLSVV